VNKDKWRVVVIVGVYFKDIPDRERILI